MKNVNLVTGYPSKQHERAAEKVVDFFSNYPEVEAVLLTCSCARGRAVPESCLDLAVLVLPEILPQKRTSLEDEWNTFYEKADVFQQLLKLGDYSHVDLEFVSGDFKPGYHGWTSGPDEFELEIGNFIAYSVPLLKKSDYFDRLKKQWLPYYSEPLRKERLEMVRKFCLNNLHHIQPLVRRGLYFQAFDRLYNAYREFLQALFIFFRVYPIAYDKWIKEQIVELLELPELYLELKGLLEIGNLESQEIAQKGAVLENLLETYGHRANRSVTADFKNSWNT